MSESYDCLLFLSFGGPEGPDDVMPFLRNVTRGRGIPDERLRQVAHHYELFGGVSPINQHNRNLIAALQNELLRRDIELPVFWGNRNWHPLIEDTMAEIAGLGYTKVLAFVTSAYSSYSGCRQYLDDIEKARASAGAAAPEVHKLRGFFNHPLFIEANSKSLKAAMKELGDENAKDFKVIFTAHSVPLAMADGCKYAAQLMETAGLVAGAAGVPPERWQLAYQSRSGPPTQPWLEPDVCDVLRALPNHEKTAVIIAPIGFVSDHMEVVYDLDVEARTVCQENGIHMVRATTAGADDCFVTMIGELIAERISGAQSRVVGSLDAAPNFCDPGCCPSGRPQPQAATRESAVKPASA